MINRWCRVIFLRYSEGYSGNSSGKISTIFSSTDKIPSCCAKPIAVAVNDLLNDRLPDSAEVLIGGSGLFQLETSPIQEMRFAFGNDKMYWKVLEDGKEKEFILSMRKNFAYSETDGHIYAGSAAWRTVNTLEMEIRRMDGLSGGRMIVRFQKENLLLEAEDTLISVGGLGISPRQALTVFGIKES